VICLEFFVEPDHQDDIIKGALAYLRMAKPVIPLCPADDAGVSRRHNEKCRHPGKALLISHWERYATSEANRGKSMSASGVEATGPAGAGTGAIVQAAMVQETAHGAIQLRDGGSQPTSPLPPSPQFGPKDIVICPIAHRIARQICEKRHYLHSYPGGSELAFGILVRAQLLGVAVLGAGPKNIACLFREAQGKEVLCLSRLWLDDQLGPNCESWTLGIILRHLRRDQDLVKALIAYSDPMAGHRGIVYQAAGFLYLGQSQATPLYRLPDGSVHHSRSLSHSFGTHSLKHFQSHGTPLELVPQSAKLTYVALVNPGWRERLLRPVLPYPPKEDVSDGNS
jgi:hypothetical protein